MENRNPYIVVTGTDYSEQATRALYDALAGPKAYVTVNCGSHELVYEQHHTQLRQASAEWLRFGTSGGRPKSPSK